MTKGSAPNQANPEQDAGKPDPFEFHLNFTSARSSGEKHLIARIKRFSEWLVADQEFRASLREHPERATELCAAKGIEVDPHRLEPLWKDGFSTIIPKVDDEKWTELALWRAWVLDILKYRDYLFEAAGEAGTNPNFAKWRARRAAFGDFCLGSRNKAIVYPVFSYELSKGCSVGCWFCAFASQKLSGIFRHEPENARLWRQVLETGQDLLGQGASQSGFCYYATEPADNPDYISFLRDFREVTGVICQTTTAAATRNLDWTRELLTLYDDEPRSVKPRFSVLSLDMMKKIHLSFTPDELLRVELIPQNPESFLHKTRSGRAARENRQKWKDEYLDRMDNDSQSGGDEQTEEASELSDFGGTTACVSGFLVNMVERTVKLVSPCQASQKWPLGYRVHARGIFEDAAGYRRFLEQCVEEHMPGKIPGNEPLGFSDGVDYQADDAGFCLRSPAKVMRVNTDDHIYTKVARLLAAGNLDSARIMDELVDNGETPLSVTAGLQHFYRLGLID